MQHDVLAALDLFHAIDAHQQAARPLLFFRRYRHWSADQRSLTLHDGLGMAQMIRRERRSGGDQIANQVCPAQPGCDLNRARQHHHLGRETVLFEKAGKDVRIGGRDALALQGVRALIVEAVRYGDTQPAAAKVEQLQYLRPQRDSKSNELSVRRPFF